MFIIGALAEVIFAIFKGIAIVFIGIVYTIGEWFNPN